MNRYPIICLFLLMAIVSACHDKITPSEVKIELPAIFPDYTHVTIPSTIAPLNFRMQQPCEAIDAVIVGAGQMEIHAQANDFISIPNDEWHQMLTQSVGDSLKVTVSAKVSGKWIQYAPFNIYVSKEAVDATLVYRLIAPGYEVYSKMGIYQRTLSDFTQKALYENTLVPGSCVNCHSFRQTAPGQMSLHLRGEKGGTILKNGAAMNFLNTKTDKTLGNCVYPYWHPSGEYIAYSVNKTQQAFHSTKEKRVEVFDLESDVVVYHVASNQLISCEFLKSAEVFETFPAFSPDGKSLYFCSAKVKPIPAEYDQIRYNLCRIDFDPTTGTFGNRVDTLANAAGMNKSVSFPRPSYDGKYMMYTLSDYGNFSIWHKEADLWLMDLRTGTTRVVNEVNSDDVDSYHSWSSNSRWVVFSSRRIDGLYTRLYLATIDDTGHFSKPFLLPQQNPDHNDALLYSYNVPEFVSGEVDLNLSTVEHIVNAPKKDVGYRK